MTLDSVRLAVLYIRSGQGHKAYSLLSDALLESALDASRLVSTCYMYYAQRAYGKNRFYICLDFINSLTKILCSKILSTLSCSPFFNSCITIELEYRRDLLLSIVVNRIVKICFEEKSN